MLYTLLYIIIIICISSLFTSKNTSESNIKKLVRQTARWATASEQDSNPYIANLHATYAMGYLMALREIYTDIEINNIAEIDIRELDFNINKIMDNAVKQLALVCPEGQPKNRFLAYLGKEGILH